MSFQGIDLTVEEGQVKPIDWHLPHARFVIILVGPQEIPFGLQQDILTAKSPYYRRLLSSNGDELENVVRLPDTDGDVFGCFQNFIYTGTVYDKEGDREMPDYPLLMGVWKLATLLEMPPLRVAVLNAMAERRQQTSCIPGTPLLIQAWQVTEEGSGLRLMLIEWAAEHMRSSPEIRNVFARSLPQEILSELVIAMSEFASGPSVARSEPSEAIKRPRSEIEDVVLITRPLKKNRKSALDPGGSAADDTFEVKANVRKPARKSEPATRKPQTARRVSHSAPDNTWTPEKELDFCRHLIDRMIQGPGFWTRLVGPFRNPVDPIADGIPGYTSVVKRPMDLSTIKAKVVADKYASGAEFEADVRLIFSNCYEYWTKDAPIWDTCTAFERYFDQQWAERFKWPLKGGKVKAEYAERLHLKE